MFWEKLNEKKSCSVHCFSYIHINRSKKSFEIGIANVGFTISSGIITDCKKLETFVVAGIFFLIGFVYVHARTMFVCRLITSCNVA